MLKTLYGITPEQYDEMLVAQNGGCSICGKKEIEQGRRLSVDHNHETGKVRGLLCHGCNSGLGWFHENTESMRLAISYLEKHKNE